MYETKAKGSSYSAKVGKKTDEVKSGCFVIEHVPTGRIIAGASSKVSADVETHLQKLEREKHPNALMNSLCQRERDLRVHEYPTKTVKEAKAVLKEIKDSVEPKYLFLGE